MGAVNLVVLACVIRAATKKGRQLFRGKKCTPRKNPGYAYAVNECRNLVMGKNTDFCVGLKVSETQ